MPGVSNVAGAKGASQALHDFEDTAGEGLEISPHRCEIGAWIGRSASMGSGGARAFGCCGRMKDMYNLINKVTCAC